MATYYVDAVVGSDGASGSSGAPFRTPGKAHAVANSGDTIKLRGSMNNAASWFTAPLSVSRENTTWVADDGHSPTFHGGYTPTPGDEGSYAMHGRPGSPFEAMINVRAAGVTLSHLRIQNVGGEGVDIGPAAHNCRLLYCVLRTISSNGIIVNGVPRGAKVENVEIGWCDIGYISQLWFVVGNSTGSGCGMMLRDCKDTWIHHCTLHHVCKEGINVDRGGVGTIIEYCTVHTINHAAIYVNRSQDCHVRFNVAYHTKEIAYLGESYNQRTGAPLMLIGDESNLDDGGGGMTGYPNSAKQRVYGNVFIGGKTAFQVRNNTTQYQTQLLNAYVGYNTFVGEVWTDPKGTSKTQKIIEINANVLGPGAHADSLIENNVFYAPAGVAMGSVAGVADVTFRNNAWYGGSRPAGAAGAGDVTANPLLAAPTAGGAFNVDNYRPLAGSPLLMAASNGSTTNGVTPPMNKTTIGALEVSGGPVVDSVTAWFTRTPSAGTPPLSVSFTDGSTVAGAAVIDSWFWEFGDGATSSLQNPTHVYAAAGVYTVSLTVGDTSLGLSSMMSGVLVTVTAVVAGSVTSRFTRTPSAGQMGVTSFAFTDTSTTTGDAVIDTWLWDFRDGSTSNLQNPTHVYAAAGVYRPRLTVGDSVRGYSATWTGPETTVSVAPPAPTLEAGFGVSVGGGQAPLSVVFTDMSLAAGGANIDGWFWEFGDGATSSLQNPTHIYAAAGSYVPRLTVTDSANLLSSEFVGAAIVVTVPPPPGSGGDVMLRQARTALNTSSGNQTITQVSFGGVTPSSVRFIVTAATADGTAADGELFCYGAAAGGAQWAASMAAEHGAANTNAARMWTDSACLLLVDADGNELMRGTFVEFTTNGVTVNLEWIGAAAAYLVTAIFGGGTKYEAWVGSVALGDVGSLADVACGFAADVVRGVATWGGRDVGESGGTLSLGMAHRDGAQYVLERSYADGLTDAQNRMRLFEGSVFHCRYNTPARGEVSVLSWSGTGFTLKVTTGAFNSTGLLMAERFGDVGSRLALVSSAIATGNADYSLDWNPQYVEHLISQTVASGSVNDNQKAGTIGIHSVTVDGEFSNEVSGENGSATTNEQSLSDNQLIVVGHTGTTVAAGATTLGTAKYSVNYTTAPGTAMVWPSLAVEVGKATGGGGDYVTAEFEASITGGAVPLTVQFVDLSAGTNAIAGWLWDFGDGTFSVERNPLKVYMVGGEFGVSLTVTDGTLSDTESKARYILAALAAAREIIVGPYLMREVGEDSTPVTHRDPDDEADGGYMEGGLILGALRLNADPVVPVGVSGEVVVYMDAVSGNLKVIRPDGTTGTITIS